MQDLPQKLEEAVKVIIDAEATGVTCYTGITAEEKTTPRITVTGQGGQETPQASGNFTVPLSIEVRSNANDKTLAEHRALCTTVLGVMSEDDIATQMSAATSGFHAFGFSNRNFSERVDEKSWVTEMTMDVYCAGLALV